MRNRTRLYVPIDAWPAADRRRWQAVLKEGASIFDDAGAAAHLAPATRRSFEDAYARLMAFVAERRPELFGRPATAWLNAQVAEQYLAWQPRRTGPRTLANNFYWLGMMLRYMFPGHDWAWLVRISNRLMARARRQPRRGVVVTSDALYALGRKLMDGALANDDDDSNPLHRALQFRDGLIIALLAAAPLRRRTLTSLRRRHLVRAGDRWALEIPAELVKTKRALTYAITADLSQCIDVYLREFRNRIPGAHTHDALWPAKSGRPMSHDRIYKVIRRRTMVEFGFAVRPHDFRTAAGTFWSIYDPPNVRGVRDLLGHASFRTTEQFYITAQSRIAGRALAHIVNRAVQFNGRHLKPRRSTARLFLRKSKHRP